MVDINKIIDEYLLEQPGLAFVGGVLDLLGHEDSAEPDEPDPTIEGWPIPNNTGLKLPGLIVDASGKIIPIYIPGNPNQIRVCPTCPPAHGTDVGDYNDQEILDPPKFGIDVQIKGSDVDVP